jgi:hypothetical protein
MRQSNTIMRPGVRAAIRISYCFITVNAFAIGCSGAATHPRERDPRPLAFCDPTARAAPAERLTSIVRTPTRYEQMARQVPGGFAGFRREESRPGWLLLLVDTAQASAARIFLLQVLTSGDADLLPEVKATDLTRARAVPVVWSLAQLHDWLRVLTPTLLKAGPDSNLVVRGVGISPERNRLSVTVGDERSRAGVEKLLGRLNVPCRLVETEISGPLVF